MNEISSTFLQSELSYRTDRIKSGFGKTSRRRSSGRIPSVRRTTRTTR